MRGGLSTRPVTGTLPCSGIDWSAGCGEPASVFVGGVPACIDCGARLLARAATDALARRGAAA